MTKRGDWKLPAIASVRGKKLKNVFLLQHTNVLSDGAEDVKIIGIYSSEDAAKNAAKRASKRQGFDKSPEGFNIDGYTVDEDYWSEGFITV